MRKIYDKTKSKVQDEKEDLAQEWKETEVNPTKGTSNSSCECSNSR
jgi:hypothetical protein